MTVGKDGYHERQKSRLKQCWPAQREAILQCNSAKSTLQQGQGENHIEREWYYIDPECTISWALLVNMLLDQENE